MTTRTIPSPETLVLSARAVVSPGLGSFSARGIPMGKRIQVNAGDRYGRLTVIEEVDGRVRSNGDKRRMFCCLCDCGKTTVVPLDYLRKKNTSPACGCRRGYNGNGRTTHGLSRVGAVHPLYRIWSGMIGRCECPSAGGYERYGGRGIGVCDEWRHDPVAFIRWAKSHGWRRGLQIERIDNDGNYDPNNCSIVTASENQRNRRGNRIIEFNGESLLLVEWSEKTGIPYDVLNQRINILGWSIGRALTEPARRKAKP